MGEHVFDSPGPMSVYDEIQRLSEMLRSCDDRLRLALNEASALRYSLSRARRVPPAVEMAELLDQLAACPLCGAAGPWRRRECCELGRLVGQVEGKSVADALMGGEEVA